MAVPRFGKLPVCSFSSLNQPGTHQLTDHLFRHEAGKMVAVLTRLFGPDQLELAEDVVQDTLLKAYATWMEGDLPANPTAWLYQVARHKAIDILRRRRKMVHTDFNDPNYNHELETEPQLFESPALIDDDMLRMMFACCHPDIPAEGATALILKTLCGFSTKEISDAFLSTEDTISKRLYRAKQVFRKRENSLSIPSVAAIKSRIDSVLNAIYLLFNAGYTSLSIDASLRKDMMDEAIRLAGLMTHHEHTRRPEVYALLALMCFQASRSSSRVSGEGRLILLKDQDRSTWDQSMIQRGNEYLNNAASGYHINTYHLEAAIAWEHCHATSFEATNWHSILRYYDWLLAISANPVNCLHRSVAVLYAKGAAEALDALEHIQDRDKLATHYLYHSILGECYVHRHQYSDALNAFIKALHLAENQAEKELLQEKIQALSEMNKAD